MIQAYRYKILPDAQQKVVLSNFFGCARFIYNWGLNIKTKEYETSKKSVSYNQLAKELTQIKKEERYSWLNDVTVESLQQSLRNLETAFSKFFKKEAEYPQKKKKRKCKDSVKFILNVHFDFNKWIVKLPKIGWVKLCRNRMFDANSCKTGTCTVSRDACGEYWCSIVVDDKHLAPMKAKLEKDNAVGIDLGIKDYAILSDGIKFPNPKYLERTSRKLTWIQRSFTRKTKGSKNREKQKIRLLRYYRRVTNQRVDYLHKVSTEIVRNYNTICIEDLNVDGMMKNHKLARSIQSASWSEFRRMLEYKSEWYGKNLLVIGRFEPSSKTCNKCGYIKKDLTLKDREWTCPVCGEHHDRDVNAARNILDMSFKNVK